MSRRTFYLQLFSIFLAVSLAFFGGWYLGSEGIQLPQKLGLDILNLRPPASVSTKLDLSLFWKVLDLLEEKYYQPEKIQGENLLYGAISGLVESIGDPYTAFFTPEQNEAFKKELGGIYEGIGAQLGFSDHQLVIVAPLENSPAQKAGIEAGDKILAVDGEITQGWSLPEAISKIRGEADTEVVLSLKRNGEIFDVKIRRQKIEIPTAVLTWKEGNVAYVKVFRFGEDVKEDWKQVVDEVVLGGGLGVVLDLRNNPGGYLQGAVILGSEFFQDGVVVQRRLASGETEKMNVESPGKLSQIPLVVLINKGSASASEIIAGAIKTRGRGKVVGETSFGKGTVQEAVELPGGGNIHITNAEWLLSNGQSVEGKGLEPDVKMELTEEDVKMGKDPQLEKALEMIK